MLWASVRCLKMCDTIAEPVKKSLLIEASNVVFGYTPDELLLKNVNCQIEKDSRIGILGANGAGKST